MGTQAQRFTPCQYQGCTRGTNDPSLLCHRHRHSQKGYTHGGQLVFTSGGPLGLAPRLAKENSGIPVPQGDNSMEIEGFPYFTPRDQKKYVDWRIGIGPRPSNAEVLDRYPVTVADIRGFEVTGEEIGIYDADGKLLTFDHEAEPQEYTGVYTGGTVQVFRMEGGTTFAIRSDYVYQVVIFDRDKLGSHL